MVNNCVSRIRRWGSGAGLAGGAFVTAAVVGTGAAHADNSIFANLLGDATANFTEANQVLSQIDLTEFPDFGTFLHGQMATQDSALTFLGLLQSAEDMLLSHASTSSEGLVDNLWFTLVNLKWDLDSQAALFWDQGVETALANNLPAIAGLYDYGLFQADLAIFGDAFSSFPINLASLGPFTQAAADPGVSLAAVAPQLAAATASGPACNCPTLLPQIPDSFLDLVQKIDGFAFTTNILGEFQNNDVIGTIAMQANAGLVADGLIGNLGINLISSQILAGEWSSLLPVTTNFFEDFVTHLVNPDAFTNGLPNTPGDFVETVAYELDNLLANTVYATDLNAADLFLWPLGL